VNPTTIRVIAGILAVIVLFIIVWRRKKQASQ
jgi:LPXTG-motif cell wall-anchored protein